MLINKYLNISNYIYIEYYIQYISFLQECCNPGGIMSHSSGIQSHSGGFLWIPVEFGHSCRNGRGIKKY